MKKLALAFIIFLLPFTAFAAKGGIPAAVSEVEARVTALEQRVSDLEQLANLTCDKPFQFQYLDTCIDLTPVRFIHQKDGRDGDPILIESKEVDAFITTCSDGLPEGGEASLLYMRIARAFLVGGAPPASRALILRTTALTYDPPGLLLQQEPFTVNDRIHLRQEGGVQTLELVTRPQATEYGQRVVDLTPVSFSAIFTYDLLDGLNFQFDPNGTLNAPPLASFDVRIDGLSIGEFNFCTDATTTS